MGCGPPDLSRTESRVSGGGVGGGVCVCVCGGGGGGGGGGGELVHIWPQDICNPHNDIGRSMHFNYSPNIMFVSTP